MALADDPYPSHATSWFPEAEGRRYELGRPGYPDAAVDVLTDQLGLRTGATVVDVAAGTGKLTRLLIRTGARVVAVEPMPGMRAQLARHAPGARLVAARAELLPLPSGSADAVTVAQAFHWFDATRASHELHRVLRPGGDEAGAGRVPGELGAHGVEPVEGLGDGHGVRRAGGEWEQFGPGGHLALVTNKRHAPEGWQRRLWDVLRRYEALAPRPASSHNWRSTLEACNDFGTFDRFEIHNEQHFATLEEFDARFASISFVILLGEEDRRALIRDLHAVVAGVDPLVVPLRTEIEVATRRG
jgi:SAM-dependent methyltransferase